MPTPAERKALLFLSGVILLGASVRVVRAARDDGPLDGGSREALARQIAAVDSAGEVPRASERGRRRRPRAPRRLPGQATAEPRTPNPASSSSQPANPIDLDVASARDIETLPRIGPVLAQRIVQDRLENGAFGSMDGFQRVRGVGPALAAALGPRVTFSGTARPANAVAQPGRRSSSTSTKPHRRAPRNAPSG